jgi:phosphoribosyl-ATP pyrophosphohydrolase
VAENTETTLHRLAGIVRERRQATAEKSYTKSLLEAGPRRCAKKFGEEAIEFSLAVAAEDEADVGNEAADVLYHLIVALESRGVALDDVLRNLEGRMGQSGHDEKASRSR